MRAEERPRYPALVRRVPRTWWLRRAPHLRFAARELTSVFAASFSVILLLFLVAVSRGREHYEGFLRWLSLPGIIAVSAGILVALLYHTATWFRLTAHIQVVRIGKTLVPRRIVTAALFGAWLLVSGAVAYLHIWL